MAVVLAQVSDTLLLVDPDTGATEALTLPDSVTIDVTKKPSIATLKLGAIIVNSPSRNLMLTAARTLILLAPSKPSSALVAAVGAGGVLTGDYQYAFSFVRKDANDNVVTESAMAALSNTVALTADQASLTSIDVSTDTDTVTGRRLYRTLSGGAILYHLADIDDNSTTIYTDNAADASLSILPQNSHRTSEVPGTNESDEFQLRLVVSWKNRLWAFSDDPDNLDHILYTEDGLPYQWGNELVAYPEGQELHGVVGLLPRRDQLGVVKHSGLWQVTGDSDLSFRIVQIAFGLGGMLSAQSGVVVNDEAFYHGPEGVNLWNDSGVRCVSDSAGVRPWFMTDRYFERAQFPNSFGKYNPILNQYELHLIEAGESVSQVWIAYNRDSKGFFGIHRTGLADFSCGTSVENADGISRVLVGGSAGQMYTLTPDTFHDGTVTPIALSVLTAKYNGGDPTGEYLWGEVSTLTRPETTGFLTITAEIGRLDASTQSAQMLADLTQEYVRHRRIGVGTTVQLTFTEASLNQKVSILGFDVPVLWKTKR